MAPRKKATKPTTKKPRAAAAPAVPVKTEATVQKEYKPWQFKKGQSGNPAGRPKGSRNRLETEFISALVDAFEEGGVEAIRKVRDNEPAVFLNVIAKILPKQVETKVQVSLADLTDDELANIAAGGSHRTAQAQANPSLFN